MVLQNIIKEFLKLKKESSQESLNQIQNLSELLHGALFHETIKGLSPENLETITSIQALNLDNCSLTEDYITINEKDFSLKTPTELANILNSNENELESILLELLLTQSDFYIKAHLLIYS